MAAGLATLGPRETGVNLHGTAIAMAGRAVLIRGRSGAGKSDLALRAIALGPGPLVPHEPVLVADDRVVASPSGNGVCVACHGVLQGLIEVRGVGIVRVPFTPSADLVLVADLVAAETIERMPPPDATAEICGLAIPRVLIAPFEASAPLKLVLALARAGTPLS